MGISTPCMYYDYLTHIPMVKFNLQNKLEIDITTNKKVDKL